MLCQVDNVTSNGRYRWVYEREGIMVAKIDVSGGLLNVVFSST